MDICRYCFGEEQADPTVQEVLDDAVEEVNERVDTYISSLLYALVGRTQWLQDQPLRADDIYFPSPNGYLNGDNGGETVPINCLSEPLEHLKAHSNYNIPQVDDYFGDIGFFDDMNFYGKFSDGVMSYGFDEKEPPQFKDEWDQIAALKNMDPKTYARNYFAGMIGAPVYGVEKMEMIQQKKKSDSNEVLRSQQLADWDGIDVKGLKYKNKVLTTLWGDLTDQEEEDMRCTLIAFSGYGSHRTGAIKDEERPDAFYKNDVTFLEQYEVRPGYKKYGAVAWFNKQYQLTEIWLSHSQKSYKPPRDGGGGDGEGTTKAEWLHAKWAWKVSLSVATFLVDQLAHNQLRESSGFIKALRKLPENHELRRLMLPFTYGTVRRGRAMNEYLREFGLYHTAFAFTYSELQRLIRDSVMDAPKLDSSKGQRAAMDAMKYRWRLFKKRISVNANLQDEIYPFFSDSNDFWSHTLQFVGDYMEPFYGMDDSKIMADSDVQKFYAALQENLQISTQFRLKKFNVVNILTHFIYGATIWNSHLNTAVSFELSVDPDFTGLKILGNNAMQNNVQNYVEYCCVALSKGWHESDLMKVDDFLEDDFSDDDVGDVSVWAKVLVDQRYPQKAADLTKTFNEYFTDKLRDVVKTIKARNLKRIVPSRALNPQFSQSSARL